MKTGDLSSWIQRYFQEYLVRQRNVSPATVAGYRDTFKLLLRYLRRKRRHNPDTLSLDILYPEMVLGFLHYLEETRGNAIRTRNARLAALRSFVHYLVEWLGPELPDGARRILAIPFKRQVRRLVGFLTPPEIEALLAATGSAHAGTEEATATTIRFTADRNMDGVINAADLSDGIEEADLERITYSYDTATKRLRQCLSEGTPNASWDNVADHVENFQFQYFDENENLLIFPITDFSLIRSIAVAVTIRQPAGFNREIVKTLSKKIFCRNLSI